MKTWNDARNRWSMEMVIVCGLLAGAAVMLAGCGPRLNRVQAFPESASTHPFYGVVWPADASRDPAAFVTVEVDGEMATTVPVAPPAVPELVEE